MFPVLNTKVVGFGTSIQFKGLVLGCVELFRLDCTSCVKYSAPPTCPWNSVVKFTDIGVDTSGANTEIIVPGSGCNTQVKNVICTDLLQVESNSSITVTLNTSFCSPENS